MSKKIFAFILSVILVVFGVGCCVLIICSFGGISFFEEDSSLVSDSTSLSENTVSENRTMTISYYYEDLDFERPNHISNRIKDQIEAYCEPGTFSPAAPVVFESSNIPKPENDAKGTSPLAVVFPEIDFAKYDGPFYLDSDDGLCQIQIFFRIFAGIPTDEEIRIFITHDGGIIQKYETVNLGKYDKLSDVESSVQRASDRFSTTIYHALDDSFYTGSNTLTPDTYNNTPSTTLFTDSEGNIIIKTTVEYWENVEDKNQYSSDLPTTICFYAKVH